MALCYRIYFSESAVDLVLAPLFYFSKNDVFKVLLVHILCIWGGHEMITLGDNREEINPIISLWMKI